MKKLIVPILVLAIVIGVGGYFLINSDDSTSTDSASNASSGSDESSSCETSADSEVTIVYNSSKQFTPACVRVALGTTITWDNQSSIALEIGSDSHPTHSSNREISNDQFTFDIAAGQKGSVKLDEGGTFGYHNHANEDSEGTVIVQ